MAVERVEELALSREAVLPGPLGCVNPGPMTVPSTARRNAMSPAFSPSPLSPRRVSSAKNKYRSLSSGSVASMARSIQRAARPAFRSSLLPGTYGKAATAWEAASSPPDPARVRGKAEPGRRAHPDSWSSNA